MLRILTLTAGLLAATTAAATAHSNAARIDEQAMLIEQGRRDGSITWSEARKLRKDQAEIARVKALFEADGRLTRAEKRILFRMQDAAEARIEVEASDLQRRRFLPRITR